MSSKVRAEQNDEQTLVVVDGDDVVAVVAISSDVDVDDAADLLDSIEAEVGHTVPGLRESRGSSNRSYAGP